MTAAPKVKAAKKTVAKKAVKKVVKKVVAKKTVKKVAKKAGKAKKWLFCLFYIITLEHIMIY